MRERDLLIGTRCLLMMFLFAFTSLSRQVGELPINEGSGPQAGGPKRTAINISSTAIPIVLTAVRNVDTLNWIEDMEFELDNRSDRPVYYVLLVIKFPDLPKET